MKKNISFLTKKIPSFLLQKNQIVGTMVFTVLFAVVFLNIYTNTSSTAWFEMDRSIYFFFTLGYISLDTIFLVLSRLLMIKVAQRHNIRWPLYIIWIVIEILVIALFYAYISAFLVTHEPAYFFSIFPKGLIVVSVIVIVPYTITALYGAFNSQRKTLSLMKYDEEAVSDVEGISKGAQIVHLSDNNGKLKFSIKLDNLFYIVSQENYIQIYYMSHDKIESYLLRCKITTIEESFAGSSLVRCHRSYIINTDKIRMIRKYKNNLYISLDHDDIDAIPVSKGYADKIEHIMMH